MKNLFISILFVCIFTNIKAQEYIPFPTENTSWAFIKDKNETNAHLKDEYLDFYCIKGDTIIDGISYKSIYNINWFNIPKINDFGYDTTDISNISIVYFIREHNKKIYFKFSSLLEEYTNFPNEYLAFDFNLTLNDTFINYKNDTSIVIEEFETGNILGIGIEKRRALELKSIKRNFFTGKYFYETWIEGVGNINSKFIKGLQFESDLFSLREISSNTCDDCTCLEDIITSNIPVQAPPTINISPNPAADFIRLEVEGGNNSIQILNTQGQIVYQQKTSEKILNINTKNFASGIYFVIVTHHNGNVSKGKFVKL